MPDARSTWWSPPLAITQGGRRPICRSIPSCLTHAFTWMLNDARPARRSWPRARAPLGDPLGDAALVDPEVDAAWINRGPDDEPAPLGGGESLAYVMYTSGSTGTPKGVCVHHRGVVRLIKGASYARFGAEEVFLQLAPIAFDAATLELWGPLLHGGRLALFPAELPTSALLGEVIRENGVTTLLAHTAGSVNTVHRSRIPWSAATAAASPCGGRGAQRTPCTEGARRAPRRPARQSATARPRAPPFSCCHADRRPPKARRASPSDSPSPTPRRTSSTSTCKSCQSESPARSTSAATASRAATGTAPISRPSASCPIRLRRAGRSASTAPATSPAGCRTARLAFVGRTDHQVKIRGFYRAGRDRGSARAAPSAWRRSRRHGPGRCVRRPTRRGLRRRRRTSAGPEPSALRAFLAKRLPAYMVSAGSGGFQGDAAHADQGKIDRRASSYRRPMLTSRRTPASGARPAPIEEPIAGIWARRPPSRRRWHPRETSSSSVGTRPGHPGHGADRGRALGRAAPAEHLRGAHRRGPRRALRRRALGRAGRDGAAARPDAAGEHAAALVRPGAARVPGGARAR